MNLNRTNDTRTGAFSFLTEDSKPSTPIRSTGWSSAPVGQVERRSRTLRTTVGARLPSRMSSRPEQAVDQGQQRRTDVYYCRCHAHGPAARNIGGNGRRDWNQATDPPWSAAAAWWGKSISNVHRTGLLRSSPRFRWDERVLPKIAPPPTGPMLPYSLPPTPVPRRRRAGSVRTRL
jgi:hypothetical protein